MLKIKKKKTNFTTLLERGMIEVLARAVGIFVFVAQDQT
jgi:hypothetical protein